MFLFKALLFWHLLFTNKTLGLAFKLLRDLVPTQFYSLHFCHCPSHSVLAQGIMLLLFEHAMFTHTSAPLPMFFPLPTMPYPFSIW